MSLELKGRLVQKLQKESGEGRNGRWEKQQFVIETQEQYPKKVCIVCWGDKISMLDSLNEGDQLNVSVNIESREYNSRWYTDVRAWRIERVAGEDPSPGELPGDFSQELPPPEIEDADTTDDLPF
ncbi:MAG: hypothetical protein DRJ09_04710 [Bacteroidetes bacterium]|nr:MAG: hypothetical protein DRJ09_04710 [Bacteroidota bacterium]